MALGADRVPDGVESPYHSMGDGDCPGDGERTPDGDGAPCSSKWSCLKAALPIVVSLLAGCGGIVFTINWSAAQTWHDLKVMAGIPAYLAIFIGIVHIIRHLIYNRHSTILACEFRMLILIPVYATDALVCLHTEDDSVMRWPIVLTIIRDVLEAVVLTSFVQFLIVSVGETDDVHLKPFEGLAEKMLRHEPVHSGPLTVWHLVGLKGPIWLERGPSFIAGSLFGLLQYVVAMLIFLVTEIFYWIHISDPGYAYLKGLAEKIKAVSCGVAMYHLLLIACNLEACDRTRELARQIGLEAKFLCVKGVIFLTLFQRMLIKALYGAFPHLCIRKLPLILAKGKLMKWEQSADTLENFLLCFELFLFAVLHLYAFQVQEFNGKAARMMLKRVLRQGELATCTDLCRAVEVAREAGVDKTVQNYMDLEDLNATFPPGTPHQTKEYTLMVHEGRLGPTAPVGIVLKNKDFEEARNRLEAKLRRGETVQRNCCENVIGFGEYKFGRVSARLCSWFCGFMAVFPDFVKLTQLACGARAAKKLAKKLSHGEDHADHLFKFFDLDENKSLDKFETHLLLDALGIDEVDIDDFFRRCDKDDDGAIDSKEFKNEYDKLKQQKRIGQEQP